MLTCHAIRLRRFFTMPFQLRCLRYMLILCRYFRAFACHDAIAASPPPITAAAVYDMLLLIDVEVFAYIIFLMFLLRYFAMMISPCADAPLMFSRRRFALSLFLHTPLLSLCALHARSARLRAAASCHAIAIWR